MRWLMLELKKFIEFHFVSEENLMHEIAFEGVAEHAVVHSELLMQLDLMLSKISHRKEFPEDLLFFLNSWLGDHAMHHDKAIADYIKKSALRPMGEELYREYLFNNDE